MFRIIDILQDFTDRQTGVRSIMIEGIADTTADLPQNTNQLVYIIGSYADVIDTGNRYKINSTGQWIQQPSTGGGGSGGDTYTREEIDEMITEIYEIIAYYHTTLVSDTGEITFYAFDGYIGSWAIFGNTQQTGTPTHDNPILPYFVGTLDGTDWKIPITCAEQTTPVYLGQTQTVRRVKKLVLTGTETFNASGSWGKTNTAVYYVTLPDAVNLSNYVVYVMCSHYVGASRNYIYDNDIECLGMTGVNSLAFRVSRQYAGTKGDFLAYIAAQYAAGHPVTVWYVLSNEQIGIVNDPLCKIGNYADELSSTDAGVAIPTVRGQNTLTVDTILKPSRIEIQG